MSIVEEIQMRDSTTASSAAGENTLSVEKVWSAAGSTTELADGLRGASTGGWGLLTSQQAREAGVLQAEPQLLTHHFYAALFCIFWNVVIAILAAS